MKHRQVSASSSLNKSQDEEQPQVHVQRGSKRHISQVTKQKIEEFKQLTEQFLLGQKVPELSELQKKIIRKQQIESVKDSNDLRKLIVTEKNEQQRNLIQNYQNKYKQQQEKQLQQQLERKTEVDERTKQRSSDIQKKIYNKIQLSEERLKQELLDKEAKTKIQGIKDIFFKQFIRETEEKSQSPSRRASEIVEERAEEDEIYEQEYSNEMDQSQQQDKKDLSDEQTGKRKNASVRSKFTETDLQMPRYPQIYEMNGQNLSQGRLDNAKQYPHHQMIGDGVVSHQFHRNNEKIKNQYYTLNRFNQFQKEIERKLKQEQVNLFNEKKQKNEQDSLTNNFVLTKEMWEKVIEADKNNSQYRLPNFGIEKTPVYKMQQNDEDEKRKVIEKKQRIKQGVFMVSQKSNINFKNIYKGVKNIKKYSTLFKTAQHTSNNLLESSLRNSINQARLVWGSSFLKTDYPINNQQLDYYNQQVYQYSIQEEPEIGGQQRSKQGQDQQEQTQNQRFYTEKDSVMSKSQSAYLPQLSPQNNQAYQLTDFSKSRYKNNTNDQFYTSQSTKERDFYTTTSPQQFSKSPRRFVYTNSHQKIKLY